MKKLKIIIVDDNIPFRKAIKTLLEREYEANIIAEAASGEEFLNLENNLEADIILMDVMMPGLDGISVAKKILRTQPHLKIVAITGHTDLVYLYKLISAGFRGCIFKSNIYIEIEEAINSVCEGAMHFPKELPLFLPDASNNQNKPK